MAVDAELLAMLVCPKCKGALVPADKKDGKGEGLKCEACRLLYKIEDDIPNMLIEDALKL